MAKIDKARFWVAVMYPENMRPDWETVIGDTVQLPYAYCQHTQDKDTKSEHRKDHVHIILAFPNTTTYQHALKVFDLLSADGKKALNKVEAVINIRSMYDYLIHDTETCRKQGKELYPPEARITGNNFDIGAFEQLGAAEKNEMCKELCDVIMEHGFMRFGDFYLYVVNTYEDSNYFDILKTYSGLFEKLTRSNFQEMDQGTYVAEKNECVAEDAPSQAQQHENNTQQHAQQHENNTPLCCPSCGSVVMKKAGKTASNKQRWQCKDCGKTFI